MFADREDAGRRLAERLVPLGLPRDSIVVGIPLEGIPVAREVARALDLPLEALICRKLRCASDHALALGALAETGTSYVCEAVPGAERLDARHRAEQLAWTGRRIEAERRALREGRPFPPVEGRTVVLVDDAACTGATMTAGCRALRALRPRRLVAALPVLPAQLLDVLAGEADELVWLEAPEDFAGAARHYAYRPAVSEKDAARDLRRGAPRRPLGAT